MRKPRHERRRGRKPAGSGSGFFRHVETLLGEGKPPFQIAPHASTVFLASAYRRPARAWPAFAGTKQALRSVAAILAGPRLHTRTALPKRPTTTTNPQVGSCICREEHKDGPRWEMRGFVFTLTVSSSHQQPLRSGLVLH